MPDSKNGIPNFEIRISKSRFIIFGFSLVFFLSSCETGLIRQQEEQIRLQQEEIMRQRRELEELAAARKKEEQERAACNRAFRDFEMAQAAKVPN